MMSIFATRRDRPTTSRRARHAKPQVEGLEQILSLSGLTQADVSNTATATSSQDIQQQGSTVLVQLDGTKFKNVSIDINADTFNSAVQQADVTGKATVKALLDVHGHKFPVNVDVTNTATASNDQQISQTGSLVSVDLQGGSFKNVRLDINADTGNSATQIAEVLANAKTVGKVDHHH